MALPNSNISVSMVKSAIGSGSNDVGTLCKHENVNKWSKKKPIRTSYIEIPESTWWILNYGISVKNYANIQAVIDAYSNREDVWEYLKPTGGASSPYRLGDFRGYLHEAISPIAGGFITPSASIKEGGNTSIQGSILINGTPRAEEIGWEDLNLDGRRLMLVLVSLNSGEIVRTAVAPEGQAWVNANTRLPLPVLSPGIHTGYLMLSASTGATNSNLAGIPNHPRFGFPVDIVSSTVRVTITAMWDALDPEYLIFSVNGYNDTGSAVSLLNCVLNIRNSQNECDSIIQQNERQIAIGTLSLSPTSGGVSQTIYNDRIWMPRDFYPSWKVCWRNTGAYPTTFEAAIIQEM